jgi:hypothetical protein
MVRYLTRLLADRGEAVRQAAERGTGRLRNPRLQQTSSISPWPLSCKRLGVRTYNRGGEEWAQTWGMASLR